MVKINIEIEKKLLEECGRDNIGFICEFGAVVGDAEFIIYYDDNWNGPFLAHISEFEQKGIFLKLKGE